MAQGRCSAVLAVALLVVSAAMAVQGADYVVGGASTWVKPNGNSISDSYLSDWAKGITFAAGDNLIFNYTAAAHNVMMVTSADYTSCNIPAAPLQKWMTGYDTIKLAAGTSYFICGTPTHCSSGQKVTITTAVSPAPTNAASGNAVSVFQAFVAATVALVATLW